MKFGILRDDVEDNWDEEGYPLYEEFLYADSLDLSRYYDCSTVSYVSEYYEDANIDESTMQTAVVGMVQDYALDDTWNFDDGLRDWEKEWLMEEDWFDVWEYDQSEFGDISFHEDQEHIIYQEGELSFDFKQWDFGEPGTTITVRLYCNGANVLIDGRPMDTINEQYINGTTSFVILRNSGIFQAGFINFLTFTYSIVEDNFGLVKDEIRVTIDVVEKHAAGTERPMADWKPGIFYKVTDDVIGPDNRLYNCLVDHVSIEPFDKTKWERQGSLDDEDVAEFENVLGDIEFGNIDFSNSGSSE